MTAVCPVCGRSYSVRQDGRLRYHNRWLLGRGGGAACSGSRRLVAEAQVSQ